MNIVRLMDIVRSPYKWETYAEGHHKEHFEVLTALKCSRNVGARYIWILDSVKSELNAERNKLDSRIEELASELDEKHFLSEKMVAELESEQSFQSLEYVSNAHVQHNNLAAALGTILIFEFQKKHTDVETSVNHCRVNDKGYTEENNLLLIIVLKSELESSMARSRALADRNDEMSVKLEEYKIPLMRMKQRRRQNPAF
ncbi:hypothetical protein YC2023_096711 [Brassica napus]